jgi:hypothetical protein
MAWGGIAWANKTDGHWFLRYMVNAEGIKEGEIKQIQ